MSGEDVIVTIFKKKNKKKKKSRLQTYSSVNKCDSICCHRRLCQKQQICLHILLHLAVVLCRSILYRKIQVSVEVFLFFFKPSSCIDRPFDLIFSAVATWQKKSFFILLPATPGDKKWCAQEHLFRQGANVVRLEV